MDPLGSMFLAGLLVLGALILYHGYRYEKALWRRLGEQKMPRVDLGDGDVMIIAGDIMLRCPEKHHVRLEDALIIVDAHGRKMHLLCPHDYTTILSIDLDGEEKNTRESVRNEAKKRIRKKAKKKAEELASQ